MVGFPNAQQEAWWQAVQQKNAAYQQQIEQALDLAAYHQALTMPRQYGYGVMANPLLSPTQQGQPSGPESTINSYFMNNAGSTFDPRLMAALLGRGGA